MRSFLFVVSLVLLLAAAVTSTGCSSDGALLTYEDENGPAGPSKFHILPLGFRKAPCEPAKEPESEPEKK